MDEVHRWVFTICCGTLLCGVVSVLLPSRGMEKLMQMVLGLFMLCCILLPAEQRLRLPPLELDEAGAAAERAAEEVTGYFLRSTVAKGEEALRKEAAKELGESGIKEGDIQIYIEADEEEGAGGSGEGASPGFTARVRLPKEMENRDGELRERLEKRLGIAVRLDYSEE
ncbi:MAG: hypothetical protein HFF11_02555 [Angelakisella sp.]|jgi:hypothetical protein|nr:hypothetical protein [Angelakisella sp.]